MTSDNEFVEYDKNELGEIVGPLAHLPRDEHFDPSNYTRPFGPAEERLSEEWWDERLGFEFSLARVFSDPRTFIKLVSEAFTEEILQAGAKSPFGVPAAQILESIMGLSPASRRLLEQGGTLSLATYGVLTGIDEEFPPF